MPQLSDYIQGYNNGWRDGVKDYKEKLSTAPASPAASVPHSSIARAIAQEERACRAEDALIDLVNQIRKSNPVDDHGHDLKMNRAYLEAQKLLDSTAPTTGISAFEMLPDETLAEYQHRMLNLRVHTSPARHAASVLTDVQILDAFEASGVQWQSVRTLANDHEYMTYGSQPAKNIIAGVRALLAASMGGDRK